MTAAVDTPITLANGTALTTRAVDGHDAIDLIRPGRRALVVCVKCGRTWLEGHAVPVCS